MNNLNELYYFKKATDLKKSEFMQMDEAKISVCTVYFITVLKSLE